MTSERIYKFISQVPGGRFFRLRYISHLPVKAEFANKGISVLKIVNVTTRTGVSYGSLIKSEDTNPYNPSSKETNNWTWVKHNKIKHNSNTNKDYLVIAPVKNNKPSNTYILIDETGYTRTCNKECIKDYIIPSYWTKEPNRPIHNICMENILNIH